MYKLVFQNSKFALIFAIMVIVSAVSMVGTSEDSGLLLRIASLVSNRNSASQGDGGAGAQAASQSPKPPSVFGDYAPPSAAATAPESAPLPPRSAPVAADPNNPMTAPLAPGAMVPGADGYVSDGAYVPKSELQPPPE